MWSIWYNEIRNSNIEARNPTKDTKHKIIESPKPKDTKPKRRRICVLEVGFCLGFGFCAFGLWAFRPQVSNFDIRISNLIAYAHRRLATY